jgi:hypothetical protein
MAFAINSQLRWNIAGWRERFATSFFFLLVIISAHTNSHAQVHRQFIRNFVSIYICLTILSKTAWNVTCVRRTCPLYKHKLCRTYSVYICSHRLVIVQSSQIWTKQVYTKKVYLELLRIYISKIGVHLHIFLNSTPLSIALTILYRRQPSVN